MHTSQMLVPCKNRYSRDSRFEILYLMLAMTHLPMRCLVESVDCPQSISGISLFRHSHFGTSICVYYSYSYKFSRLPDSAVRNVPD